MACFISLWEYFGYNYRSLLFSFKDANPDCLMLWSVFASNSLISDGILVSKVVTGLADVYTGSRKAMLD